MEGVTLTKADIVLELIIAIGGGLFVLGIVKYLPIITNEISLWWYERSKASRAKRIAEIHAKIDKYKSLLENQILFQAKGFELMQRMFVFGIILITMLAIDVYVELAIVANNYSRINICRFYYI